MTDKNDTISHEVIHLVQRLNQALDPALEYDQRGGERDRLAALAELEAVRDEIDEILAEQRNQ